MPLPKLFATTAALLLLVSACSQTEQTRSISSTNKNFIQQGTVVVCVGGAEYYTSQGFLGGCGDADIDFIVYNVNHKVGQVTAGGKDNDIQKAILNRSDIKKHFSSANRFYSISGIRCDCGGGTVVSCNSTINTAADCEGICDEAKAVKKKYEQSHLTTE